MGKKFGWVLIGPISGKPLRSNLDNKPIWFNDDQIKDPRITKPWPDWKPQRVEVEPDWHEAGNC